MLKRSLAAALGLLALCSSALAQQPGVNSVPQTGVLQASLRVKTYGAVSIGLVPAAAATDIFCIGASASKTVSIARIELSGTATTALSTPVVILRRASLDTGGTAATGTALPVAAPFATNAPNSLAATASLTAYTANPTIIDSSPGYFRVNTVNLSPAATAASADQIVWTFGTTNDGYEQNLTLVKGTTQQVCVNLNGASPAGGSLSINLEWNEQ